MMTKIKLLGAVSVVMAMAGCRCTDNTGGGSGEIGVVFEQGGVRVTQAEGGTYDFDKVSMGTSKTLKLTLVNTGRSSLTVAEISQVDGDATKIGETGPANPVFTVNTTTPFDVSIGQQVEVDITFNAPLTADPAVKTTEHLANLLLKLESAATESATVTLKGTAVSGACDIPRTLDFGAVATGDQFTRTITFENPSPIDTMASAAAITSSSGDDANFAYAGTGSQGTFPVQAGKSKNVDITFKPTENRDYLALVKMKAADACPEINVTLIGTGVDAVLTYAPSPVLFGYVAPGVEVSADVTFENRSFAAVTLSNLKTNSAEYTSPTGPVEVPAGSRTTDMNGSSVITPGTAKVALKFKPNSLGRRDGQLNLNTTVGKQPMLSVILQGFGGGPDIDVKPNPTLNFGKVAFFDTTQTGGTPYFVTRKLTVQNVGTRPPQPAKEANLHLGQAKVAPYADGVTQKYWAVAAKGGGATDAEICVGRYDAMNGCVGDLANFNNDTGIVAGGATSLVDVPVRITPTSVGIKEWEVTVYSSDTDEAETKITIRADVQVLPPCNASITPLNVNFGLVTPPDSKDLAFTIRNNATQANEICLINGLDMKAGSDPIFSLPAGAVDSKELQPGETMNVVVRAWPQGAVGAAVSNVTGAVTFSLSDPMNPQRDVNLQAAIATGCLTIAPDDLDFGTVKKDCFSARRDFSIYNTCATPVTINSFGMVAGAGLPAGAPGCAGTMPCPEFLVDGTPNFTPGQTVPANSSTPLTFALKYRPLDYGADNGAYLIKVTQNGQQVDYIVTLRGNGDMTGANTDTFRQDTKPKADILLVIDDSGTMAEEQLLFGANFGAFIKYANTAGVDYQIGVIGTELTDPEIGKLHYTATNPKILKPTTPNVEQLFKDKVMVGTFGGSESICEPAIKALTAPLITSDNAGFLRPDAVLAVVGITDAAENGAQPATVYENQFRNIKGAQRPNLFSFSVVGPFAQPTPAGCNYDETSPDVSKFQYLIGRFNGIKEEICSPNWAPALEKIGQTAFGYRTNFFLTAEPQGGTVQVAIDGVPLAPTDPRGAPVWSYDAITNAVNFEPLFVPEPGRTLTVSYVVACRAN